MKECCNESEEVYHLATGMCYDCYVDEYYTICPSCETINDLNECEHKYHAKVIDKVFSIYEEERLIKNIPFPESIYIDIEANIYPCEYPICNHCADKIQSHEKNN